MIEYDKRYDCADDEALARLKSLAEYWRAKFGIVPKWVGGTAHFDGKIKGVKFKGDVVIENGAVRARIDAGFLAEKLGAKKYVARKVDDYLDAGNSLESLQARVPS